MTLTVRPIQAEPFPEALRDRHQHWRVTLFPAHDATEPVVIARDVSGIVLPPGTQVVISSSMVRLRFSVFVRAGVPVYETLHGSARPAVTVVSYRRASTGIDVGVIFQKRYFCENLSLRPYCDEEGFLLCGEPPGGGIEDTDESPP